MPSSSEAHDRIIITPFAFDYVTSSTGGSTFTLPHPTFAENAHAAADPNCHTALKITIPNGIRNSGEYIIHDDKVYRIILKLRYRGPHLEIDCSRVFHTESMEILQDIKHGPYQP